MTRTVDEIMTSLQEKEREAMQLRLQLANSLLIRDLWPDAFKLGTVKLAARATVHAPHEGTITIKRQDGEERSFPAMQVPYALWPASMKADFMNMRDQHLRRRMERMLK